MNEEIELIIAGRLDDLAYVESLKEEAEKNGFRDQLKILGPIKESEKAWYLQNCLAYMHPSFAEGFGLPVVEAMHFGKPLFLSNLTSLPEIGGDVAFYFENFDPEHMQNVFKAGLQQYEVKDMARKVKERGAHFSWSKSAQMYIKVYQSLL
jgi:glycosyltransferase involved in cell wall biosynthesis